MRAVYSRPGRATNRHVADEGMQMITRLEGWTTILFLSQRELGEPLEGVALLSKEIELGDESVSCESLGYFVTGLGSNEKR